MKLIQSIKGVLIKGNTIIQQLYKNDRLLDDHMKTVFKEIDILFENQEYETIEDKINDIYIKKQDRFNDKIERSLLKYKCFLVLVKNQYDRLDELVKQLEEYGKETEEIIQVKFNIAIFKKDSELFYKLKDLWKEQRVEEDIIEDNEIKFLYLTNQYEILISKFNKKEKLNRDNIKFYVAKSLKEINRFEEAKKLLESIKDNNEEFKLEYVLCDIVPIFMKPRYLGELNNDEKIIISQNLEFIESIDSEKLKKNQFRIFIYYKLQMLLFNNKKLALDKISDIPEKFVEDIDFLKLKINILTVNYKYDEANDICNFLLENEKNINFFIDNMINIKLIMEKWKDIIDIFHKYRKDIEKNQFIFYSYGIALIQLYGEETALTIIEKDCKIEGELISLLYANINIKDCNKCEFYLEETLKYTKNNELILLDVANIYEKIGEYKKAVDILENSCKYDIRFFKKYISIIINNNLEQKYREVLEIYMTSYNDINNEYVNSSVYGICIKNENYRYAYCIAERVFRYKANTYWKNEYVKMKLLNKDFSNLKKLAEELYNDTNPEFLMTASEAFLKLGEIDKVEELIYKIAYDLDTIDINFAIRICNLLLKVSRCKDDEVENYEMQNKEVKLNDVVILKDDKGKQLIICLNKEICYRNNTLRFGCMHIDEKSDLWIELLGRKINEQIQYKEKLYIITEIIDKLDYLGRICFNKRITENIENIEKVQINEVDELSDLKEKLMKLNNETQRCVDLYMNKNNKISSPINIISNEVLKLEDVIEYLLENKNTRFITGIPFICNKGCKVVLTTVTVLFLYKNNLLEDFMQNYSVYVPSKMISMFENILNDLTMNFDKKETYLRLIGDKIFLDDKDRTYKKLRIKKYKDILETLKKGTVTSMDIFKSKVISIPEQLLFTADIEAMEIAKDKNLVVFVEDKFLFLICSHLYNIPVTNTSGFINSILFTNFKKFWNISEKLIKGKYEYFFNEETLALFIIEFDLDSHKSENKFKKIINLILQNDLDCFYRQSLINICRKIFYRKLYGIMKIRVDIIMNEIKKFE